MCICRVVRDTRSCSRTLSAFTKNCQIGSECSAKSFGIQMKFNHSSKQALDTDLLECIRWQTCISIVLFVRRSEVTLLCYWIRGELKTTKCLLSMPSHSQSRPDSKMSSADAQLAIENALQRLNGKWKIEWSVTKSEHTNPNIYIFCVDLFADERVAPGAVPANSMQNVNQKHMYYEIPMCNIPKHVCSSW